MRINITGSVKIFSWRYITFGKQSAKVIAASSCIGDNEIKMRACRIDKNQPDIVETFRALGWEVLIVSQLKNCCDLFVSKNGITIAIEVKDGSKPRSARKLTKGEQTFKDTWKGRYAIVECLEDVLSLQR
jgi:hypothetical protein